MKITLCGAAGEVTGSSYHVQTASASVLVDFGLFQGSKSAEKHNRLPRGVSVEQLNAIVLTHAHLDHTGRLPLLARDKYRHSIHATPASIDLTRLILRDAAQVEAADVARLNRRLERAGKKTVQPLFTAEDVSRLDGLFQPAPYGQFFEVAPGIQVRLVESGHILGSASIEMIVEEEGRKHVVVFSGDLGPRGAPLLRDPTPFKHADMVFMESTYGDRDHKPLQQTIEETTAIVKAAVERKGKILVPAFAIGRTQQILYVLAGLFRNGVVPAFPVYLDSPMAIEATKIYAKHFDLFDEEALALAKAGTLRQELDTLRPCVTADESRALNTVPGPCMIVAGSGMCNAGRILHHLRHNLYRPETLVMIVGYQGEGTLGRQLVEGKPVVSIFGEKIAVRASIHTVNGFSAHAGQTDLLHWLATLVPSRPRVVLTHGEARGREPLAEQIRKKFNLPVELPMLYDVLEK